MLPKTYNLGSLARKVLNNYPSFKFRDKDPLIHNASDAAKDSRAVVYKALGHPESNPIDFYGQLRLRTGSWIEQGLKYDLHTKMGPFGTLLLSSQGDTGEHGTFYGASWHGYRDFDLGIVMNMEKGVKIVPFIVEVKTKIGFGAWKTIKPYPTSKKFIIPTPDTAFGNGQQVALYLRDAYRKTLSNSKFTSPIKDAILLQFLYADKLCCFVEYYFEYDPEKDMALCYRVHCEEYPECCGDLNIEIPLVPVAQRWVKQDQYIKNKELPLPDYQRKYDVHDVRVRNASKKDLEAAISGNSLIGDIQKKYDSYRDLEAKDLGISLAYSPEEIKILKNYLKDK